MFRIRLEDVAGAFETVVAFAVDEMAAGVDMRVVGVVGVVGGVVGVAPTRLVDPEPDAVETLVEDMIVAPCCCCCCCRYLGGNRETS